MFDRRLISAEVLKLRHRRGMLAMAVLLTLGLLAVVFTVMGIQHGSDPVHHAPAGGETGYLNALGTLTIMAFVVGTIIGATAGTQDLESGVFRDLAATGRSRKALFGARVMGAWAIVMPILATTMAALAVGSIALADKATGPSASTIIGGTAAILIAGALATAVAVGASAIVGSRGPVIGGLLAFFIGLQPALTLLGVLGDARQGLPLVGIDRIGDIEGPTDVKIALGMAIVVPIAWSIAALGIGARRTATREI